MDRRIIKSQAAIKIAVTELMAEKSFDDITIQDIHDRATVNRRTIYLYYTDKYNLLDKMIEEHINNLRELCKLAAEMIFKEGNYVWFEYFERNYLFFSTMLAGKGAPYFHSQFLQFNIEEFKNDVDITKGKNYGQNEGMIVQFVANAYVGVVEWWLKNGMPYPPHVMAEKVGELLERNI